MADSMSAHSGWATKASDDESSSTESEKLKIVEDEEILSSTDSPNSDSTKINIIEDITIFPVSKIKCQFCEKKVDKQDYEQHKKDHDKSFFTCTQSDCDKKFKRKSSLRKHLYFHQGKFKYECDECKAQFIDLNKFQLHQTIKHKSPSSQDKFKCNELDCGRSFATSEYLRRHQVTHNDEYKYPCQHCDQKFKWLSSFQSHQTIHNRTTSEIHSCKHCQKSFTNRKILERHVKIHKNVKYKCDICESVTSARKDNIRRHIKHLHSNIEKCDIARHVVEYEGKGRTDHDDIEEDELDEKNEDDLGIVEIPQPSLPPQQVFNNRVNVIQSIGNPSKCLIAAAEPIVVTEDSPPQHIEIIDSIEPEKQIEKEMETIKLPPKKNPVALGMKNQQSATAKPKYDPIEHYRKILLGFHSSQSEVQPEEEDHGTPTQIHWRKRASQNFLHHQ